MSPPKPSQTLLNKIKCKFFPSYSKGYTCPEKYPFHLGASFGAPCSSGILCNGKKIKSERAKAYAIIRNGSITNIHLINNGSGYSGRPRIKISGNGKNAEAKCETNEKGSISNIKIFFSIFGMWVDRTK